MRIFNIRQLPARVDRDQEEGLVAFNVPITYMCEGNDMHRYIFPVLYQWGNNGETVIIGFTLCSFCLILSGDGKIYLLPSPALYCCLSQFPVY